MALAPGVFEDRSTAMMIGQGTEEPSARARIGLRDPFAGGGLPLAAAIDGIERNRDLPAAADQHLAVDVAGGEDQAGGAVRDPVIIPKPEKPSGKPGPGLDVAPDGFHVFR